MSARSHELRTWHANHQHTGSLMGISESKIRPRSKTACQPVESSKARVATVRWCDFSRSQEARIGDHLPTRSPQCRSSWLNDPCCCSAIHGGRLQTKLIHRERRSRTLHRRTSQQEPRGLADDSVTRLAGARSLHDAELRVSSIRFTAHNSNLTRVSTHSTWPR